MDSRSNHREGAADFAVAEAATAEPAAAEASGTSSSTPTAQERHVLRLYVAGNNPRAHNTILRVRQFCDQHLKDRYQLEVIDIYQQAALARREQIVATPTLVKYIPQPRKVWVGDLSKTERLLTGLGLPAA